MLKFDHHLHTERHSPDSIIDPLDLIERAAEVGLDGVVITEHDHQWHREEVADLAAKAGGLVVLSGAEVSAREGHFLVYGLPDLEETPPGIRLRELIQVVKAHKAAIVAAHPYRWDQDFDSIIAEHGDGLDGVELVSNNVTSETRAKTARLLGGRPMTATGSSDGHEITVVGCYYSEINAPVATIGDFVRAIKSGKARPGHRSSAFLMSGPVGPSL